ncbi:glycosyltransferase family 2 protein [Novosphingobium flavum]|uniref:Glycosyltransferase family 2 protein n=1 Tax=Novosphingobium flavum TaxID=1778672 RepID=A0A7X1FQL6_9SPHN|nr:glycosyltransferase family 2 protein [Novosphingobium flavum]MBC2665149.1 glycosyltransferase family 2 protein [Novosphingobium flavum]
MTETARPALSIVAPCYNEEGVLHELHQRLVGVCRQAVGWDFEIVLIDDGSRDRTRAIIGELCAADPHVVGVFLSRNHGHQLALTAGLNICRGERVLIIDADLQDPPELLHDMMALMDGGADVVYGQRTARDGESAFKRFTADLFYRILGKLVDVNIPPNTGDFRLMSRPVLDELNRLPEQHRFVRGLVSWIGYKQVPLQYHRHARFAGTTHYPVKAMIRFAIDAITGFSTVPLRMATYLGLLAALVGICMMGWAAYSYFAGIAIRGWTTIMAPMLILGSTQLLVLGVIGEYLGRLYMQSKNRPLFIIEEIKRSEGALQPPLHAIQGAAQPKSVA